MKWQHKAVIQATLSRVPFGYQIHRKLQDVAGTVRLDIDDHYENLCKFILRAIQAGMPVKGKVFLDIGTGWHPIMPTILSLLGASRIVTIDLNPWLTLSSLRDTLALLSTHAERIAKDLELPTEVVSERLGCLLECASAPDATIGEVLRMARIEYLYPTNARDTGLPAQSFDAILSYNVFEHIPPTDLKAILAESRRILVPGGMVAHHVGLSDHFSHRNDSITSVNFLKFSPRAWYWIGGSGLAYHNRLRGTDFVRMFESENYRVLDWNAPVDRRALAALERREVVPHPDFSGYTFEDLSGELLNILAVAEP